tara:strand:+ start:128 stop:355 length:228 start_codon:yes stop_codon:yes gene_type:complete
MSLEDFMKDLTALIVKYEDKIPKINPITLIEKEQQRLIKRRLTDKIYYEKNRDKVNAIKRKSYKKLKEEKKKMLE